MVDIDPWTLSQSLRNLASGERAYIWRSATSVRLINAESAADVSILIGWHITPLAIGG